MDDLKKNSRIAGALFLLIFVCGVLVYQFLRGPYLFSEDYLILLKENETSVIFSVIVALISATFLILAAILLFPVFRRFNSHLAIFYIASCIVNIIAIYVESSNALNLLEISKLYFSGDDYMEASLSAMGQVVYASNLWTHYLALLISCLPLGVFYFICFMYSLIPRVLSAFGLVAVILMGIEMSLSLFDLGISMNLMLPLGLIQFFLPFWLMIKGLNLHSIERI